MRPKKISDDELVGMWYMLKGRRARLRVTQLHVSKDPMLQLFGEVYKIGPTLLYRKMLDAYNRAMEQAQKPPPLRATRRAPCSAQRRLPFAEMEKRDAALFKSAQEEGKSLCDLAAEAGLSREGARLVLKKFGYRMTRTGELIKLPEEE
jgi:hypothetical protein